MVLRLNKLTIDPYNCLFQIPANLTMGTGLTFTFITLPSNEYPSDLGLAIVLGVTVKTLVAGATDSMSTGTGTEQTVTITHQSTKDEVSVTSLAIASANLNSAVGGQRHLGQRPADRDQRGRHGAGLGRAGLLRREEHLI